ncbi:hypothetical protein [Tardiphaga sp. 42S5]|uniref:hypothetical protein n=1 Tax=Tardiphaga sp. 42S5 TaxID=1404799 RepID=UPI002A59ECC9|nr:hypothetical protein [Tardiphaga sp. 42S5]WPO43199.1 hypothetical protein SFY93_08655 [Tardiphaga sp. 42S5]
MPPEPRYTGFKHHARVQSFRFFTMLLAWGLLIVTFVYKPEWIRDGMRAGTRAIESVGDSLPSYWGAQAEIILRELGGFLWIQITAVIVAIRTIFWLLGSAFRR